MTSQTYTRAAIDGLLAGITKASIGLGNVDNTADATKPVSAAQQTAISAAVASYVAGAPGALDTLNELAAALGNDQNFAATVTAALADRPTAAALADTYVPLATVAEVVQDVVGGMVVAGTNVTVAYNDAAGTITINASGGGGAFDPEATRDAIGAALVGTGLISVTVNDAADTITITTTATANSTDAALRDRSTHTGTQAATTVTGLSTVATSGVYNDLTGKPTLGTAAAQNTTAFDTAGAATAAQSAAIQRANHTGTQSADTLTDGTTNKAFLATERTKLTGIASGATANRTDAATDTLLTGKADLVGGVVPTSQIPALALTNTQTVASQAAMLALTTTQVQVGDIAVRTDGAGTFILTATDPSVLGNWTRLNAPTDAVTSVNSQTGTVVLSAANVGAEPAGAAATAQAAAIQRANHTGTQAATTITGLATVATTGVYTDLTGRPTIPAAYTDEQARDALATALVAGTNITITPNDGADTITIAASGGTSNSPTYFIYPESYIASGTFGDNTGDAGPAISAAYAAAYAVFQQTNVAGVTIKLTPGKHYRIATAVIVRSGVTLDATGAFFTNGTGVGPITAGNNPAVPSGTDKAAQTAGAAFTDNGTGVDNCHFIGGQFWEWRYAFVAAGGAWGHCTWEGVAFGNCNIGIFIYQGAQNPKVLNCYSFGNAAGTTFVALATCFPSGHVDAGKDNFFCDGFFYENTGDARDGAKTNATFDAWFQAAILRPTTGSVVIDGTKTMNPSTPGSSLNVSGRSIYIPSRNNRLVFFPTIRYAPFNGNDRGAAVIGNPWMATLEDISGENMWGPGGDSMILLLSSNGSAQRVYARNIDTQFATGSATYAIEVVKVGGSSSPTIYIDNVTGNLDIADGNFVRPELGVGAPQAVSGNYTLQGWEAGTMLNHSSAGTLTIPPSTTVRFPVGATILIYQEGTGQVTVAAGSGVTLRSRNGAKTAGQYAMASLFQTATDVWVLSGDVTT